jgi:hypothetical protein
VSNNIEKSFESDKVAAEVPKRSDMQVELGTSGTFSKEELELVEQLQHALESVNFVFDESLGSIGKIYKEIVAVVHPNPTRLGFIAYTPGRTSRVFLFDHLIPLTPLLFEGDKLVLRFLARLEYAASRYFLFLHKTN